MNNQIARYSELIKGKDRHEARHTYASTRLLLLLIVPAELAFLLKES